MTCLIAGASTMSAAPGSGRLPAAPRRTIGLGQCAHRDRAHEDGAARDQHRAVSGCGRRFFLSHCPGHLGEYLALTGQVIDGPQAVAAGLADHAVASERLDNLWEALADYGTAEADTRFDELDSKDQAPGVGHSARSASTDQLDRHRLPGRHRTC